MGGSDSKVENMDDGGDKSEKKQDGGDPMTFDPDFKGPIQKRGCTDMICCILFIAFSLAFLCVGVWAYTKGDPKLLLYPTDSDGNLCGYGDFEDKPYLFFFDLIDCARVGPSVAVMGCPTPQVCVKKCPKDYFTVYTRIAEEQALEAASQDVDLDDRSNMICKDGIDPTDNEYEGVDRLIELIEDEDCAAYYLDSTALAGRCIPAFIQDTIEEAADAGSTLLDKNNNTVSNKLLKKGTKYLAYFLSLKEYGMKILQDLRASWWMILVGTLIAAVWCFIWITLMRFTAGVMVWVTIIAFIIIFGAAFYFSLDKYLDLRDLPSEKGVKTFTTNLSYYTSLKETWLALSILTGVILVVILILVIFLRKRIRIAISLIKEAARGIAHMVSVLFFPLLPFAFMVFTIGYWAASAVFLASMGDEKFSLVNKTTYTDSDGDVIQLVEETSSRVPCDANANNTEGEICNFFNYGTGAYVPYVQAFQAFTMLWILNWLVALSQMTIAGAFASYYWAFRKPDDIPKFPVLNAFVRSVFYHTGTMAFGALLLTLVQVVRIVLEYLDRKLKGKENCMAKFLVKCLKCCFWCLEKFVKFINKNAYTMCAVYGKNFCRSAFMAFGLIIRNILRVAVMDQVVGFICFIGKLVVTGVVVFFAYLFFSGDLYKYIPSSNISDYVNNYSPELNFYLVPVIVIGIATFLIASGFFAVYGMGVDAIFMCFLQDCEVNDGSEAKPYYMNKELMQIIGEKNEKAVDDAKKE